MDLVDVHCHLDHERFKKDLNEVIKRAEESGVRLIITSGTGFSNNKEILELSLCYKVVKPSFGFYPLGHGIREAEETVEWIKKNKEECIAIGEVGMDFSEGKNNEEEQREIFLKMILLSKELDLPVVIHSRKAETECVEILEREKMRKVIMHCFSGKKSLIRRCVENGWFLSVPPVIKRLQHFETLVNLTPLNQLLTETDAPWLSPFYGERNEPSNVLITIKEIAKIKEISEEEVAKQIFHNAAKLFRQ